MDRGQRPKHIARCGSAVDSELAHWRLDTDATLGNTGGRRRRGGTFLFRKNALDYRTSHLRRRWRIINESGNSSRNTNRIAKTNLFSLRRKASRIESSKY